VRCACAQQDGREVVEVNGIEFDVVTREGMLSRVHDFVSCGGSHTVRFVPAHPVVLAKRDADYARVLRSSALLLADGVGPRLAASLKGIRLTRISGTEGMHAVFSDGRDRGVRHYLFGGSPHVAEALSARLRELYGEASIVGVESPPFRELTDEEWRAASERMQAADADVVWVGLGTPKQDHAAEKLELLEAAPVIACVGAAFDFIAGSKRRAPDLVQKLGLEWAFRLAQEPTRLGRRYLVGNVLFVVDAARATLARHNRLAKGAVDGV
jgi:N-acetylglucosaminyldiphosphoundecaprenol N-acetyl-beta-D-mannosaminyltransferase